MVDITATEEGFEKVKPLIGPMKVKLFTEPVRKERFAVTTEKKNEGFSTSAQIQYVCRAGNYMTNTDYAYTGALRVLRVMPNYPAVMGVGTMVLSSNTDFTPEERAERSV